MKAIFYSGLENSRAKYFKGYQCTFPEFLTSLNSEASDPPPSVPVNYDLKITAMEQLWSEVKIIIGYVNQFMKSFIKLFGV